MEEKKVTNDDFPVGLVTGTLHSQCRGPLVQSLGGGTKISQLKILHAAEYIFKDRKENVTSE